MVVIWIQNEKVFVIMFYIILFTTRQVIQQRLGVQLVGIFCEAEGPLFSKRVSTVLPLLSEHLSTDDHVSIIVFERW